MRLGTLTITVLALRERARSERGSAPLELLGFIPLLGLAALGAWQLLLYGFAATSAENAARTGSRVASKGGAGEPAAKRAMPTWLRDGATAEFSGTRGKVTVQVPIIFPPLRSEDLTVSKEAELPSTTF